LDGGALISDRNDGGTALHWGATVGHDDLVRVALERGAVIDDKDASGDTPLHIAVSNGHEAIVRRLLDAGADVTLGGRNGHTAMYKAIGLGASMSNVLLLLQHGADPKTTVVQRYNKTLLSWAKTKGREVIRLLEPDQDWFDIHGRDGQVLLTWAVEKGYEDIIHQLSEMGLKKDLQS
jgi:ankyrin repeat protein